MAVRFLDEIVVAFMAYNMHSYHIFILFYLIIYYRDIV